MDLSQQSVHGQYSAVHRHVYAFKSRVYKYCVECYVCHTLIPLDWSEGHHSLKGVHLGCYAVWYKVWMYDVLYACTLKRSNTRARAFMSHVYCKWEFCSLTIYLVSVCKVTVIALLSYWSIIAPHLQTRVLHCATQCTPCWGPSAHRVCTSNNFKPQVYVHLNVLYSIMMVILEKGIILAGCQNNKPLSITPLQFPYAPILVPVCTG